jgi:hypothetical protein
MSAGLDRRMRTPRRITRAYVRGPLPRAGSASACRSRAADQTGSTPGSPTHVRKILLALVATAPAALSALPLLEHEIAGAGSAQLRAACLECDRVTAESRADLGVRRPRP